MPTTEVLTGTITATETRQNSVTHLDEHWYTIDVTDGRIIQLRGTDRLNYRPEVGETIRFAARQSPKGHYSPQPLHGRDVIDPRSQQIVQIEPV